MGWLVKTFKELSPQELYFILRERNRVCVLEQNCLLQEYDEKDMNSLHMFKLEDDEIISYLRIVPPEESCCEAVIGMLLVNPNYRGCGLAKEMLRSAIKFIKDTLGQSKIKVSTSEYLASFYEGLGFESIPELNLDGGYPSVDMLYQGHQ